MTDMTAAPEDVVESVESDSFLRDTVRVFRKNKMAMLGLILVSLLFFVAFFIPLISPHDPYRVALD